MIETAAETFAETTGVAAKGAAGRAEARAATKLADVVGADVGREVAAATDHPTTTTTTDHPIDAHPPAAAPRVLGPRPEIERERLTQRVLIELEAAVDVDDQTRPSIAGRQITRPDRRDQ